MKRYYKSMYWMLVAAALFREEARRFAKEKPTNPNDEELKMAHWKAADFVKEMDSLLERGDPTLAYVIGEVEALVDKYSPRWQRRLRQLRPIRFRLFIVQYAVRNVPRSALHHMRLMDRRLMRFVEKVIYFGIDKPK